MVVVGAEGFPGGEKSQKLRKAEDLGLRIISENDFCRMAGIQPPEDIKQQYYAQRDLLSMYRGLREDHLRYLQKWGLIRPVLRTNSETYYAFPDLVLIRQVSAELQSAPFRAVVKSLQAERSGQLAFDFRIDAEPARIIKLKRSKPKESGEGHCRADRGAADDGGRVLSQGRQRSTWTSRVTTPQPTGIGRRSRSTRSSSPRL